MKATIDGIGYEGTEGEIRRIAENPPHRPHIQIIQWPDENPKPLDMSPRVTFSSGREDYKFFDDPCCVCEG